MNTTPAPPLPRKVVLVAKHIGINFGGEAIKAYQYAERLRDSGAEVVVVTHERTMPRPEAEGGDRQGTGALADRGIRFLVLPDTALQRFLWRVKPLQGLLDVHFHFFARRLILANAPRDPDTVLHYLVPISPVMPRFFPGGYDIVLGPLNGNIFYPPAFRDRMSWKFRTAERLHALAQRVQRVVFPEKRRVRVILVSGYERTRVSLRLAGVPEEKMIDVLDSGISDSVTARPRVAHEGRNPRFACSGRMVDHKGTDLAIRAVAEAAPDIRLDIYGDGEKRAELEALARSLGLADRVRFLGWLPSHDDLLEALSTYRGYVFPSLAEANGIVMQEAMMLGLPVIATRWGGPEKLADETSAIYIDPISPDHMVRELARAMTHLAENPQDAENLSKNARKIAEENFPWKNVAQSWINAAYTQRPMH